MVRHGLIPAPIKRVEALENSTDTTNSKQDEHNDERVFIEWENEPKIINPEQVLIPDQIINFREFKFTEKERLSVLGFFDCLYLPQFAREQLVERG